MFTMYGDYSHMMWLLHNIKTMQIYKFTYNPVLLLFVHKPDRVSGRFITNIREFRHENELGHTNLNLHSLERACSKEQNDTKIVQIGQSIDFL